MYTIKLVNTFYSKHILITKYTHNVDILGLI